MKQEKYQTGNPSPTLINTMSKKMYIHPFVELIIQKWKLHLLESVHIHLMNKIYDTLLKIAKDNATNRDRTSDLKIFSLTLSQLSYSGYFSCRSFQDKVFEFFDSADDEVAMIIAPVRESVKLKI